MSPPPSLIRALFQPMGATGSTSTILRQLGVALSMLLSATILAFYLHLPLLLGIVFAIFTGITLALYLFTHIYCLFKDPELLRSEKHSIQKLAIEKGFVGDSLQGVFELKNISERVRLTELSVASS